MTNPLALIASALIASLPLVVIGVLGIVLSRSKLQETHAEASRLATVGFSLLVVQALVGSALRMYVTYVAVESGDRLGMTKYLTLIGVATSLLLWSALVLLLLAVIADRSTARPVVAPSNNSSQLL